MPKVDDCSVFMIKKSRPSSDTSIPSRRDLVLVLASRYAGVGLSFGVSVLITHIAAPSVVGLFFWLVSVSSFLSIFACCGLNTSVHGFIAKAESLDSVSGQKSIMRSIAQAVMLGSLGTLLSVLLIGVLPLRIQMLDRVNSRWLILLVASIYASALAITLVQTEVYRYRNKHLLAGLSSGVINNLVFIIAVGLLFLTNKSVSNRSMLVVLAASGVVGAIPAGSLFLKDGIKGNDWAGGISVVRISAPAMATNVCAYVVTQAQGIFGGVFLSSAQNAILGSTGRLCMIIAMSAAVVLQTPLAASVRALARDSPFEAQAIMARAARNAVCIVTPFFLLFFFFGSSVLALIFGEAYRGGADTLRILALAALVNAAKGSPGQILLNSGNAHLQMALTIVGALFALLMFGLAGLTKQPEGLAIGVLASVVFQALIERHAVQKRLGIDVGFSLRSKKY